MGEQLDNGTADIPTVEVLAVPWGEVVILAAGVMCLVAVICIIVAVFRHWIPTRRAVLAVIVTVLVPVLGAILVVSDVVINARRVRVRSLTGTGGTRS